MKIVIISLVALLAMELIYLVIGKIITKNKKEKARIQVKTSYKELKEFVLELKNALDEQDFDLALFDFISQYTDEYVMSSKLAMNKVKGDAGIRYYLHGGLCAVSLYCPNDKAEQELIDNYFESISTYQELHYPNKSKR